MDYHDILEAKRQIKPIGANYLLSSYDEGGPMLHDTGIALTHLDLGPTP